MLMFAAYRVVSKAQSSQHHNLPSLSATIRLKHCKKKQSKSSQNWIQRQRKDPYVKKAQALGLPSRASFKLQEINEVHYPALLKKSGGGSSSGGKHKSRLLQPHMNVIDLGASPGSWSLYASTQVKEGTLVAVDLLSLDKTEISLNLPTFEFIQGDFTHTRTKEMIIEILDKEKADLVMSDMAMNFTGDQQTDALRTMNLCEQALMFSAGESCFDSSPSSSYTGKGILSKGGSFLCKFFSCGKENEQDLMQAAKRAFRIVHAIKPKASRKESSEMYLLAVDKRA
jgi:23S rRNA (uridine2552-2'-O)-methyltransferase